MVGLQIAIVEDCDDIRNSIVEILSGEGCTVAAFVNGAEAMKAFEAGKSYSLVLLDLMMPIMDGWEVLDIIERDNLNVGPLVVMSAVTESLASRYSVPTMAKPFDLLNLLDTVEKHAAAA